jgi:hypothetical protein
LGLLLAFWFAVGFDAVHVALVGRFAFGVDSYAQSFSLLLVYACFPKFIWAEAFLSGGLFAVLFDYYWFNVMQLFASFLLFIAVASSVAIFVAWPQFFCASAAVMKPSDVFACAGHTTENSSCMLWLRYPADILVGFYGRCVGVNQYDFKPFVLAVFANPVAVEHFKVGESFGGSFFCN